MKNTEKIPRTRLDISMCIKHASDVFKVISGGGRVNVNVSNSTSCEVCVFIADRYGNVAYMTERINREAK